MKDVLTPGEARRIAIAAQGLAEPRPERPTRRRLLKAIERIRLLQIDSVNVVSRSHYLPLFSRLGAYPRPLLEDLAWGRRPELFEYWMHEASLAPLELQPMMRWRMADARAGVGIWKGVARFMREHPHLLERAKAELADRGPLAASDLDWGPKRGSGWWSWDESKRALECLFWAGEVTTATRRGAFERVYGLTETTLPRAVVEAPTPDRADAQRYLLALAARAFGVATEPDLRDYYRMTPAESKPRVAELAEIGELVPVTVKGWSHQAYLHKDARRPRRLSGAALLSPFDSLVWFRDRTERLFGLKLRLEIYTPAEKRTHGYYVLPFLEGDRITARVDLKAERKAGVLQVQAAHAEPAAGAETPARLAAELRLMAGWLGLERVEAAPRGDLAGRLAAALA